MTYVPIVLRNVGNGAALDFRIGFNKLKDNNLNDPKYLSSTSMNVDDEFYLGFFAIFDSEDNNGVYLLEIFYRDMFDNRYKQSSKFIIEKEDKNTVTNIEIQFKQEILD